MTSRVNSPISSTLWGTFISIYSALPYISLFFFSIKFKYMHAQDSKENTFALSTALERNSFCRQQKLMPTLLWSIVSCFLLVLCLRKFAALFPRLLSSFKVLSRLGANIKFYNRPIRFRKPETRSIARGDEVVEKGGRRGEEAHFLRQEMRVSLLSPSLPGRSDPVMRSRLLLSSPRTA